MKTIIHLALLCMAMLMSQSCGGASHKNSDSEASDAETENAATEKEESSESSSGISFKTIPHIYEWEGKWKIGGRGYIIVCNDSGTPIMYDDEMAATYDSYAFAFFCAQEVADSYSDYLYQYEELGTLTFNSATEALNKWESDYAPQIDPYLELCLNMPVAANVCPPQIQEWFNEAYYDHKDKNMYLKNSGYGFRRYEIGRSSLRIYRFDDEDYPKYNGALAIDWR